MKNHKTDNSPKVIQRDKIKDALEIRELKWTDKQKEFIKLALDHETKVVFVKGPAGSSKTLLSVYAGLTLLNRKSQSDIIYVRSAVESSDSKIGFLPGTCDLKFEYYNVPLLDKLNELLPASQANKLLAEERVRAYPINFARGLNWNAKVILMDESQNSSIKEIITVLTRLGKFTKCFILADPEQTDLKTNSGGFEKLYKLFSDEDSAKNGIKTFEFNEDDIMRSELVKFIVKKTKTMN